MITSFKKEFIGYYCIDLYQDSDDFRNVYTLRLGKTHKDGMGIYRIIRDREYKTLAAAKTQFKRLKADVINGKY